MATTHKQPMKLSPTLMLHEPRPDARKPRAGFSQELRQLAQEFSARPARISEILEATQGRGFNLLLLLIGMPFLTPIPLPGFSTPFGFVVLLLSLIHI